VIFWSQQEVHQWLTTLGPKYVEYIPIFQEYGIDGRLLCQLDEQLLLDDLHITNGIIRKKLLNEISLLQKRGMFKLY